VKIVSGLPLNDMEKQAESYRKALHGEHTVSVNGGQSQIIYVQDVIIFGEGAGAIWDSVLDTTGKFKRKPQQWERVVDIGYRTVDFCALQNMFYVESQSTSFPSGIFQAQEKTYQRLSKERDVRLETVDPGDLELRDLAQKIISHMNRIWVYDKDNIQLAGGGAYLLRKYLQYPVMPEPEWVNASGYYKVGVVKWRGEL
jgi:hypothetical protein